MSRRWRYPRTRRGSFYAVVPPMQATAPPPYPPAFQEPSGRNSRLAAMRSRRGLFFATVRADSIPPRARRYVVRLASARHGKFFSVPVTVVASVASWTPPQLDPARRALARPARRGKFFTVPPVGVVSVAAWVPANLDPARRAPIRPWRRGRFYAVPLTSAPTPAPWVPPNLDPGRRQLARLARRGEFFTIPLVGAAPSAVPWVPALNGARRPVARQVRRGRFWSTPSTPSMWVPQFNRQHARPVAQVRRGHFQPAPVSTSYPPRMPSRRPRLVACRRGQVWRQPWPQVVPAGPGPYIPAILTSLRRTASPVRRGVFIDPPWTQIAHSCTTPRPNAGITVRPAAGITVRLGSGVTARPASGSTGRPNTGVTDRPCGAI